MVGSRYCNTGNNKTSKKTCGIDPGGHFIITGSEKVIISQERQAENKAFCFHVSAVSGTRFSHCVPLSKNPASSNPHALSLHQKHSPHLPLICSTQL